MDKEKCIKSIKCIKESVHVKFLLGFHNFKTTFRINDPLLSLDFFLMLTMIKFSLNSHEAITFFLNLKIRRLDILRMHLVYVFLSLNETVSQTGLERDKNEQIMGCFFW